MPCSRRGQSGDLEYKKIIASPAGKVNRNSPTKNALGKFSSDGIFPPRRCFVTHRRRDIPLGTRDRPGGAGVANAFETGARPLQGAGIRAQPDRGVPPRPPPPPFGGGGAPPPRGGGGGPPRPQKPAEMRPFGPSPAKKLCFGGKACYNILIMKNCAHSRRR